MVTAGPIAHDVDMDHTTKETSMTDTTNPTPTDDESTDSPLDSTSDEEHVTEPDAAAAETADTDATDSTARPDTEDDADEEPLQPAAASTHPKADEYLAGYATHGPRRPQYTLPPTAPSTPPRPEPVTSAPSGRWTRPSTGRLAAGVAVGIARRVGLPTWLVRAGFVFLTFTGGAGLAAYLAAWALMPKEGDATAAADRWRDEFDNVETTNGKIGIALIALAVGIFLVTTGVFVGPIVLAALIVAGVTMSRSKTA